MIERVPIALTVNHVRHETAVDPRLLLSDFLREELELTGVRVSCEHGVCGACTLIVDGRTTRSCLMLAVQADGAEVRTVEGLASGGELHPIQVAFWKHHGLQCGFCTPGMLMTVYELLERNPEPSETEVRESIAGNICRCTGYVHIVDAVMAAAAAMRERGSR